MSRLPQPGLQQPDIQGKGDAAPTCASLLLRPTPPSVVVRTSGTCFVPSGLGRKDTTMGAAAGGKAPPVQRGGIGEPGD